MDKRELINLSRKELYDKYEELNSLIYLSEDYTEKDKYKIIIEEIRNILDDKELNSDELYELYSRKYLPYPDHNNPNFNTDISKKLEFNSNKLNFNQQSTCGKQNFELGNHQRLLYNFMNKNTPYKSLLIFHGVGVGKTCTAVKISESFRDIYAKENNKIIVLRKGGLGEGWKKTIFDPSMGDNQCSGHEFLDLINETKGFEKREEKSIKRDVNKLIKKYYDFYAYREFSNSIDNLLKNCKNVDEEKYIINKIFSNRLLIVDEYHNLRDDDSSSEETKRGEKDEQKKALKNLLKIVKNSDNLRLILLTATPMFNMSEEIFNLLNILLLNDKRPTIDYKKYIKDNIINEEGLDILNDKFKGYVSYLRGENPVNFPIRIYPNDYKDHLALLPKNCPSKDLFGKDIPKKDRINFLITYENKLQGPQKKEYLKLLSQLDDEKKLSIQDSNLKQICNVYYPSKKNSYGIDGFKSIFNENKNKFSYKKDIEHILDYKNLHNYSIKIKNIIDNINNSDGIIFIYSEYIWGGAVPMGIALEHIGFEKYDNKNLLNITDKSSKKGTYIILSRNDKVSGNNDEELKVVTSEDNKDGNIIKVIIGSSITGEGMDFKNIRQIHVLDPWWHLSKLEQIIGRGIRYCSHIKLPEEKRNVTVFLHTATCDSNETIDHYSYRIGEKKSFEVGKIETILKKNAFDCYLFKDVNIIKDTKDILKINVKVSKNDIKMFKKSIADKPYSKICSYQKECDYSCENTNVSELNSLCNVIDSNDINEYKKGMKVKFEYKNKSYFGDVIDIDIPKNIIKVDIESKIQNIRPSKLTILNIINDDTINFNYFKDLKRNILNYLSELYRKNKYYLLDEIVDHIQYNKNIDDKIIYNILKNIIDFKSKIYDESNNPGYIICKNNIYIYQSYYNNDESAPIFYRTNIDTNNKISTDIISENIKDKLDKLIKKKSIIKPKISDIGEKIKTRFKEFFSDKILLKFKLVNHKYKQILFNSCLDELSFEERQVFIKFILKKDIDKVKLSEGKLLPSEIYYLAYEYYKNQSIQKNNGKYTLFNYDKECVGYMLMNKNELEYYDLNDNIIDKSLIQPDIEESIKSLDKLQYDKIFSLNSIYIQPYINYNKNLSETGFRYTYKFFDGIKLSKGVIVGNDPGYTKTLIQRFLKLNLDEFKYLKQYKDDLFSNTVMYAEDKFKIIELVFRIKNISNNCLISNELNYLRLIK